MTSIAILPLLWLAAAPAAKLSPMSPRRWPTRSSRSTRCWVWRAGPPRAARSRASIAAGWARPPRTSASRRRASARPPAIGKGLPSLGKSYVLAILMADIGPVTVVALGIGDAAGWGAYSCDPGRKCPPQKLDATKKWGKRLIERREKACAQANTIWFPEGQKACEAAATPAPAK